MAKSTLKTSDLRDKSDEELAETIRTLSKDVLNARFENYTNRLNDTSRIRKVRRDLARALTVRTERANKAAQTAAPAAAKQGGEAQ